MDILINEDFKNRIEDNLNKIPFEAKKDFVKIKKIFPLSRIDIVGGFVRDSILQSLYDYNFPVNDLDILIEDFDFENKTNNFLQENRSRFGGLKFKYDDFSMDFFGLGNVFYLKNNSDVEKNLENFLWGCDLTTSAFGYNLGKRKLYSCGGIEDVFKKEINVYPQMYLEPGPTISRLILHSDKMDFHIGKNGLDYIRENYFPETDDKILDFLKYKEPKKFERLFGLVKEKVNEIVL